jgi:hypothetical protein
MSKPIIVLTRNGRTTVLTGWRAWAVGMVGVMIAWLLLALLVFAWIGIAVTFGVFLLLAVPAIAIVALVRVWIGARQP